MIQDVERFGTLEQMIAIIRSACRTGRPVEVEVLYHVFDWKGWLLRGKRDLGQVAKKNFIHQVRLSH